MTRSTPCREAGCVSARVRVVAGAGGGAGRLSIGGLVGRGTGRGFGRGADGARGGIRLGRRLPVAGCRARVAARCFRRTHPACAHVRARATSGRITRGRGERRM